MKKIKLFALALLLGVSLVGCDSSTTLRTYTAPSGATLVTSSEAALALEQAATNFGGVSSVTSSYQYYSDNTVLYSGALEPYATSEVGEIEVIATVYDNNVMKLSTSTNYSSSVNQVYTSTLESDMYLLIDEYTEDETTYYRVVYHTNETTQGVTEESSGIYDLSTYTTSESATLAYNTHVESLLLEASNPGYILSLSNYFSLSSSTRFTTDGSSLYYTYYNISRSSLTNPLYPSDETKVISSYTVSNYQITYDLIDGSYYLSTVNALSAVYVANDFSGKEFSEPYVITSNRSEATFTYDTRSTFNETLDINLDNTSSDASYTVYATTTRISNSSETSMTLTDYTTYYKRVYDSTFEGVAYYRRTTISYDSTLVVSIYSGSSAEPVEYSSYDQITINDRNGKVTKGDEDEIILGSGTYSIWVVIPTRDEYNVTLNYLY